MWLKKASRFTHLLLCPPLPPQQASFAFPFWQSTSHKIKFRQFLEKLQFQNPLIMKTSYIWCHLSSFFREWRINNYYNHNLLCGRDRKQRTVRGLTIRGTSEEDISAELESHLHTREAVGQRKRMQGGQSGKGKFFRGTTRRWLALDKNQCLPFLIVFLIPSQCEKFCEGMVNF